MVASAATRKLSHKGNQSMGVGDGISTRASTAGEHVFLSGDRKPRVELPAPELKRTFLLCRRFSLPPALRRAPAADASLFRHSSNRDSEHNPEKSGMQPRKSQSK